MHSWFDVPEWPYFNDVDDAAREIGLFLVKWGRINVRDTKEKYGTARVYCSFGWDSMHSITHPRHVWNRYPAWLRKIDYNVLQPIISRLNWLIVPYHLWLYKLAYKRVLKRYSHIALEILDGADYTELLSSLYTDYNVTTNWENIDED